MVHSAELNTIARRTSSAIPGAGPHVGMSSKIAAGPVCRAVRQADRRRRRTLIWQVAPCARPSPRASPEFAQRSERTRLRRLSCRGMSQGQCHLDCRKSRSLGRGQHCRTRSDYKSIVVSHGRFAEIRSEIVSAAPRHTWKGSSPSSACDTFFRPCRHISDDVFYPLSEIFFPRTSAPDATACDNSCH